LVLTPFIGTIFSVIFDTLTGTNDRGSIKSIFGFSFVISGTLGICIISTGFLVGFCIGFSTGFSTGFFVTVNVLFGLLSRFCNKSSDSL